MSVPIQMRNRLTNLFLCFECICSAKSVSGLYWSIILRMYQPRQQNEKSTKFYVQFREIHHNLVQLK